MHYRDDLGRSPAECIPTVLDSNEKKSHALRLAKLLGCNSHEFRERLLEKCDLKRSISLDNGISAQSEQSKRRYSGDDFIFPLLNTS